MRGVEAKRRQKVILVLVDGVGDVAIPSLNNCTPLQHANTPCMDELAEDGLTGLMDPVEPGLACGSDTAHLSILGYNPRDCYRGRGSFEAMGAGLDMQLGDVAFKCNFATAEEDEGGRIRKIGEKSNGGGGESNPVVKKRRVDRNFPTWGIPLCDYLDRIPLPNFPQIQVAVSYATEHRCGVRLRGEGLSDQISGTDPLKDDLPLRTSHPLNNSSEAEFSAKVLNEVSNEISKKLSAHPLNVQRRRDGEQPANVVLLRGPGERIKVPPFLESHQMRAFMIAPTAIIAGLGLSLEMDVLEVAGATGDYHTSLSSKASVAVDAITQSSPDYDFGFVHVKAVDDAGHDKDVQKKVEWVEECDKMLQQIVQRLVELPSKGGGGGSHRSHRAGVPLRFGKKAKATDSSKLGGRRDCSYTIVVTADHSTPVLTGDHSYEPVPFLICDVDRIKSRRKRAQNGSQTAQSSDRVDTSQQEPEPYVFARADKVNKFNEIDAAFGSLGRFPGGEVMNIIKAFCRTEAKADGNASVQIGGAQ